MIKARVLCCCEGEGINAVISVPSSDHHRGIISVFSDLNHTQKQETPAPPKNKTQNKTAQSCCSAFTIKWFLSR